MCSFSYTERRRSEQRDCKMAQNWHFDTKRFPHGTQPLLQFSIDFFPFCSWIGRQWAMAHISYQTVFAVATNIYILGQLIAMSGRRMQQKEKMFWFFWQALMKNTRRFLLFFPFCCFWIRFQGDAQWAKLHHKLEHQTTNNRQKRTNIENNRIINHQRM